MSGYKSFTDDVDCFIIYKNISQEKEIVMKKGF
jgi:hypothetical protein